jgi:predicted alpha/beta-hydrolase family hydrolase
MPRSLFLLAPGAGAPSSHPWMQRWKARLEEIGEVETFDYPYMRENRKRPDPLLQLIAAHRQALVQAKQDVRGQRPARQSRYGGGARSDVSVTILIGKSMGGRIGCHVALEEKVDGLICLGYPLCSMGDRTRLRNEVLRALTTPILFVQGTRDSLCPLDLLEHVRTEMSARPARLRRRSWRPFLACGKTPATSGRRNPGRCRSTDTRSNRGIYRPIVAAFACSRMLSELTSLLPESIRTIMHQPEIYGLKFVAQCHDSPSTTAVLWPPVRLLAKIWACQTVLK